MGLPWYYLERPTRIILLRCYYTTCALAYPVYVGLNWNTFLPDRSLLVSGRSLQEEITNPLGIKK